MSDDRVTPSRGLHRGERSAIRTTYGIRGLFVGLILVQSSVVAAWTGGNDWLAWTKEMQFGYVAGVIDDWKNRQQVIEAAAKRVGVQPQYDTTATLVVCVEERNMTRGQVVAIVEKYMNENPAEWHHAMASLVWTALNAVCRN